MTTAQVLFSFALGVISLIIVAFAAFVVATTAWGDRWARTTKQDRRNVRETENT